MGVSNQKDLKIDLLAMSNDERVQLIKGVKEKLTEDYGGKAMAITA
jgi:hypothetical protein